MKRIAILILAVFGVAFPSSLPAKEVPKIAVWDLTARNIKPEYAQELTSILVSELTRLRKYEVYSWENIQTMAGFTAERMKLGCTDSKCLTALGQMDITKLVSGSVAKIGSRYSISLNLFDTSQAKVDNAISQFCNSEDELIELIQKSARTLLTLPEEPPLAEKTILPEGKKPGPPSPAKVVEERKNPPPPGSDPCDAPRWNAGDLWTFKAENGRTWGDRVVQVEKNSYFLESFARGGKERFEVDRETMNLTGVVTASGKRESLKGWYGKIFNFPLHMGKSWEMSYYGTPAGGSAPASYGNRFKVEAVEEVGTPAGAFRAYRIHHTQMNQTSGRGGSVIWWYSPQAKQYVKRKVEDRNYWSVMEWLKDCQLVSYELK